MLKLEQKFIAFALQSCPMEKLPLVQSGRTVAKDGRQLVLKKDGLKFQLINQP